MSATARHGKDTSMGGAIIIGSVVLALAINDGLKKIAEAIKTVRRD